ncbi:transcription factor bHLH123 isoform X2 [Cornus florida]|uniref:transcription factor bHLH123 isoform X2 n=1 Tax=Cornus florida TaxID=4283 RepID=UPI0028A18EE8|nr:transcription factor bHLH123 isoform X2 [Cornus florida]
MADQFQIGGGNWWDSSSRNRFDTGSSPSSTALNSTGSFGWPSEIVDTKPRSSIDSGSVSGTSNVFQDPQKLQGPDSSLQMIGLSLPSQAMDWNQALLRTGKTESSFSSVLQEDLNSSRNYQQESGIGSSQEHWRQKMYSGSHEDSSVSEFKQRGGFSLEQPQQFSSHISSSESSVTCQALPSSFQIDSAVYGSPSTMLQGFLGSDNQPAELSAFENQNRSMNFPYPPNYAMNSGELLPNSWSKFPQFMRNSPSKHTPHSQLQFSNNATYWNASAAATNDVRSSLFHPLQPQFPMQSFDEKMKNTSEVRDSGMAAKKSSNEPSSKRPRSETPSTLPAFKVRKEKMGDRITALQQLVSPFGKTDTASVLSEAIEYIKFLHEQVLSTPYLKSGTPIQQQQNSDKSKDPEGPKQDLKSRGLCLVPVSSTYPVTHETTVDFWTPTFGGTFR